MTPSKFKEVFAKFDAVCTCGDFYAACPVCQSPSSNSRKLHLSRGNSRLLLGFCFNCCVPGDSSGVFAYWHKACEIVGVTANEFIELKAMRNCDEIDALWKEIAITPEKTPTANTGLLNAAYTRLLDECDLIDEHRRWLRRHGLDSDWAFAAGYRSSPSLENDATIAAALWSEFGDYLKGVPGFLHATSPKMRIAFRRDAIMTPCRNAANEIFAIKFRMRDGGKGRMRLLTSSHAGGAKAVVDCHVPVGVAAKWSRIWLTEGERKADVVWTQRETPIVAVPGVNSWRYAIPLLTKLTTPAATVVLALDKDAAGTKNVQKIAAALASRYRIEIADFDARKIDDAVIANKEIRTTVYDDVVHLTLWCQLPTEGPPTAAATAETAAERANKTTSKVATTAITGRSLAKATNLHDHEIVGYIREVGEIAKIKVPCFQRTLDKLIKDGVVKVRYSQQGPMVSTAEV